MSITLLYVYYPIICLLPYYMSITLLYVYYPIICLLPYYMSITLLYVYYPIICLLPYYMSITLLYVYYPIMSIFIRAGRHKSSSNKIINKPFTQCCLKLRRRLHVIILHCILNAMVEALYKLFYRERV